MFNFNFQDFSTIANTIYNGFSIKLIFSTSLSGIRFAFQFYTFPVQSETVRTNAQFGFHKGNKARNIFKKSIKKGESKKCNK